MPSKVLSVVVPVFNNARTLGGLLAAMDVLRTELGRRDMDLEVVFVDDGSSDDSYAILARRHLERGDITVARLTRNFGAIRALKAILELVHGDVFLFLAADLQDPPTLIPAMVDRWLEGHKYVVARRLRRNDTALANAFAKPFYWLLRKFVVETYPPHGFDLAMMDRQFLPYLQKTGKHINIPLFPFWLGFTPFYIDYERQTVPGKKSSWTFGKKLNLAIDSLLSFSRQPTRVLFGVGFCVSVLSFVYATFIVVSALLGRIEVPGFATTIVLMSILNGLTLLLLAIMSEYLWRIFDEVNGHPEAVVDHVLRRDEPGVQTMPAAAK